MPGSPAIDRPRQRNARVSSSRLYWENPYGIWDAQGASIPAAVSVFPHDMYQAPRSWAERSYPNLIFCNEVDRGSHCAARQEPALFADEVRNALRTLPNQKPLSLQPPGSRNRSGSSMSSPRAGQLNLIADGYGWSRPQRGRR